MGSTLGVSLDADHYKNVGQETGYWWRSGIASWL